MEGYIRYPRGRFRVSTEAGADHELGFFSAADWQRGADIRTAMLAGDPERTPENLRLNCVCEVCGLVIGRATTDIRDDSMPHGRRRERIDWQVTPAGGDWEWRKLPKNADPLKEAAIGNHDHGEDLRPGLVRFYYLAPVGQWKTCQVGDWVDVVAAIPRQGGFELFEEPTLDQVNAILADGGLDVGMGGGIECPFHRIDENAWPIILQGLRDLGRVIDEQPPLVPGPGTTREDAHRYIEWMKPRAAEFRAKQQARLASHDWPA